MIFVREIRRDLYNLGLRKLNYLITPINAKYPAKYYEGAKRTFLTQFNLDHYTTDY